MKEMIILAGALQLTIIIASSLVPFIFKDPLKDVDQKIRKIFLSMVAISF